MRLAVEGRSGTALLLAGLLVVSVLIVVEFASLSAPSAGNPSPGQPGGGGRNQGNNTTSNNPGGRLVARVLMVASPSSPPQPVRGISLQIDANTTAGTIKPKSIHVQTNFAGYAFASLVPGPYILSAVQQGWRLIGSFDITEGRTTDFNVTVAGIKVPVKGYDIGDPDSSSTLGPWATMAVSIPRNFTLGMNQTVYFETAGPPVLFVLGGPLYINIRNQTTGFPPQNTNLSGGPSTSAAVVVAAFPYSSGQWVTLQPLGTMAISQFYQTDLLTYQATYKTGLEAA